MRHWFVLYITAPLFFSIAGAQLVFAMLDGRTFGLRRSGDLNWVSVSDDQFGFWLAIAQALGLISTSAFCIISGRTR